MHRSMRTCLCTHVYVCMSIHMVIPMSVHMYIHMFGKHICMHVCTCAYENVAILVYTLASIYSLYSYLMHMHV